MKFFPNDSAQKERNKKAMGIQMIQPVVSRNYPKMASEMALEKHCVVSCLRSTLKNDNHVIFSTKFAIKGHLESDQ